MTWENIFQALQKFGFSVIAAAVLAWWLRRDVWPWFTKLVSDLREDRKEDQKAFLSAIERRDEAQMELAGHIAGMAREMTQISLVLDRLERKVEPKRD